jgi:hypothetical protein
VLKVFGGEEHKKGEGGKGNFRYRSINESEKSVTIAKYDGRQKLRNHTQLHTHIDGPKASSSSDI